MPRLVSFRPGGVASGADLSAPSWQLAFAGVPWEDVGCFSLVYRIPPNPAAVVLPNGQVWQVWPLPPEYQQLPLLRIAVPFAVEQEGLQGIQRVAAAANLAETQATCRERTREALTLFRNGPRLSEEAMTKATDRLLLLVDIAWDLRAWLAAGSAERKEWTLETSQLVGLP